VVQSASSLSDIVVGIHRQRHGASVAGSKLENVPRLYLRLLGTLMDRWVLDLASTALVLANLVVAHLLLRTLLCGGVWWWYHV
jgi:hypothetical protein